ncbi:immunoglobulin-like domain-containing protein [Algibacter sp. PT7-4]|uniref:immunoglobulin-like domain-containing protein n=1 Tax=Algibacter ulvanivorans TaxID=3400999 RepID=UPI003AAE526F
MKKLLYIFFFLSAFGFSQIASVKAYRKYINNNQGGILRVYINEPQASVLTVNYTVSGAAASKTDLTNGSVTFQPGEISKLIEFSKTGSSPTTRERLEVDITPSANYTISRGKAVFVVKDEMIKAFPSAYGAGAYATGGRGGVVYHVTTLDDPFVLDSDGVHEPALDPNTGDYYEGTFRRAISSALDPNWKTTPRIIVFDVSGTIVMHSRVRNSNSANLTILGQTAPEGGITIEVPRFDFNRGKNLIFRYFRVVNTGYFHPLVIGGNSVPQNTQGIAIAGGNEIVLDHIDVRYVHTTTGISTQDDNNTGAEEIGNTTIQWTLIADCNTAALLGGSGSDNNRIDLAGSQSFHHNLIAHSDHRPNISGNGNFEYYNNVMYNYGWRMSTHFNNSLTNRINNTYRGGTRSDLLDSYAFNKIAQYQSGLDWRTPRVFTSGEFIDRYDSSDHLPTDTSWDDYMVIWRTTSSDVQSPATQSDIDRHREFIQFPYIGTPLTNLESTSASYNSVLADVGANKYLNADGTYGIYYDAYQQEIFDDIANKTRQGTTSSLYRDKFDANALLYPVLPENNRLASFYVSDTDIPENWFQSNVPNGSSGRDINPNTGRMYLEDYANSVDILADPDIPVITVTGALTVSINVGDSYTDAGATANDLTDGDITDDIVTTGSIDTTTAGTYYINYNVSDSESNVAQQKTRTINVNEVGSYPVTNIVSSNISQTGFTISWDAVNEAVSYDVEIDSVFASNVTGGTTYNATNLTSGTTYTVNIITKDASNEIGSASIQVTTSSLVISTGKASRKSKLILIMN